MTIRILDAKHSIISVTVWSLARCSKISLFMTNNRVLTSIGFLRQNSACKIGPLIVVVASLLLKLMWATSSLELSSKDWEADADLDSRSEILLYLFLEVPSWVLCMSLEAGDRHLSGGILA